MHQGGKSHAHMNMRYQQRVMYILNINRNDSY